MMPTPLSLLALLLQITTIIAHPLKKRKGGRGGGGGGGGGMSVPGNSVSWRVVFAIVGSILGAILLVFLIFHYCLPGGRLHDWAKRVGDERLAKKRARNKAGDSNASVNEGQGKAEMRGD